MLFQVREAFRSGDIWLPHSRRYADLKQALVPIETAKSCPRLTMPFEPEIWLDDRKARLADGMKRLAKAARTGAIPGGSIESGVLKVDRLTAAIPADADGMVLDLYGRLPAVRITDLLQEVDDDIGFSEAFTHLRTGVPCKDRIGLLNVLLAEGLNLGLSKMAEATSSHDYFQLSGLSRWHVESDAITRALAKVIEAQTNLPMAQFWGGGMTASSDGQFFPTTRHGEAMNLINAKYGQEPGLKAYTHVSDQFGPFATQNIPATVNEAPYILDGLLMNEVGQKVKEQYADTGGFTVQVFAATALLSYRFVPHIRDLPSKRLYLFDPSAAPKEIRGLVGGKIREKLITENWPDILRAVAIMAAGVMPPSQLLRKFASEPVGVEKNNHYVQVLQADAMATDQVKVTDAAAMAAAIDSEGKIALDNIYFDFGSAVLQPASDPAITEIARLLADRAGLQVYVVGHTDSVGTLESNLALSRARAQSVVDALEARFGVATGRAVPAGVGPLAPVATNATDAGRQANRRVEIVARQ